MMHPEKRRQNREVVKRMDKIEKVKQGLRSCRYGAGKNCFSPRCPYADDFECLNEIKGDALDAIEQLQQELEKGQETCRMDDVGPDMRCSGCGETIDSEIYHMIGMRRIRYCPLCGRKVKEE